ncbi:MAG: hypothetical protein RSF87_01565 [Cellulosilyticaceae bacterium]
MSQITMLLGSLIMLAGIPGQILYYNQKPEIITLYTEKKIYKIGEPIDIKYFYTNEQDEKVEERWTYRQVDEENHNCLYTKPEVIFVKGDYVASLRLKDEQGNWSKEKECIIKIRGKANETEYQHKFGRVPIGTTLDNFEKTNYREFKTIDYDSSSVEEGTLLMSNSPEAVQGEGILYQDTVKGKGRLLVHHINEMKEEGKRLVVLAQNEGTKRIEVNIRNSTFKGPSKDILFIGQQVIYEYLKANTREHIYLEKGESYIIYDSLDKGWKADEAISGMLDFDVDGPLRYTIAAVSVDTPIEEIARLKPLERDVHPRGTFRNVSKYYTFRIEEREENSKIVIGDSDVKWEEGIDAIKQKPSINKGNFGIVYRMQITVQEDMAVILNPRGDMFKGAIKWEGIGAYLAPKYGYFPSLNRAAYLGVIKEGDTKELIYILPCGSSAPVVVGLIPKRNWIK